MTQDALVRGFIDRFGKKPARTFFSPGRVNLIGEYTDFNGGYVLPAAIDLGTYYAVGPNGTRAINIYSETVGSQKSIALNPGSEPVPEGNWQDYVVVLLYDSRKRGLDGGGLDIFVRRDLPQNSGLSSSTSFTTGLAFLLNDFWGTGIGRVELACAARRVENDFVGVQCGIMDQFAVALGRAGHCIYLHCQSLGYDLVPANMEGYEILIADSRLPRRLASSAYNARRAECSAALAALRKSHDFACLVEASRDDIEACEELKSMPLPYKRARHVVSENARVQESVAALRGGNLARFRCR